MCNSGGAIEGQDGIEQGIQGDAVSNCRYGSKENEGNYGHDDGVLNQGQDLNAKVFNYRHDLDVPEEGQEVDGTGYEGDEEGIGGGNEVDKEGQGEKKENLRYWIHPEDGQSDDNDKDWEPG